MIGSEMEKDSPVPCKLCSIEFISAPFLQNHMIHFHGYNCFYLAFYRCICNFGCNSIDELQQHLSDEQICSNLVKTSRSPNTSKAMVCPMCSSAEFITTDMFCKHIAEKHLLLFKCQFCQFSTNQKCVIQLHVLQHPVEDNIFCAKSCDFKSLEKEKVIQHEKTHFGDFSCHACNLKFWNLCKWRQHLLTHEEGAYIRSDEDYYSIRLTCNLCLQKFESTAELSKHRAQSASDKIVPKRELEEPPIVNTKILKTYSWAAPEDMQLEEELTPSRDFEDTDGHLICSHCLVKCENIAQGELHMLIHKTSCCQECDYKDGCVKFCSEHSIQTKVGTNLKPHKVVLKKFALYHKEKKCVLGYVFKYACMNCPLVVNEETSPSVISSHFFCSQCHYSAKSVSPLHIHILSHSDNMDVCYGCPLCPTVTFSSLSELHAHLDKPHSLKKLKSCIKRPPGQKSTWKSDEGPKSTWKCSQCPTVGRSGLVAHMKDHPIVKCPLCQITLKPNEVKDHLTRQELQIFQTYKVLANCKGSNSMQVYQCIFCPKTFLYKSLVDEHISHEHKNACRFCSSFFSTKLELMMHLKSHREVQEKFTCKKCFFILLDEEKLKKHEAACYPTGFEYHMCKLCQARHYSETDLLKHERKVHFLDGFYKCPRCDVKNKSVHMMLNHLKFMHRGDDNLGTMCECSHCQNSSVEERNSQIFEHFWTCEECGEILKCHQRFVNHQKTHEHAPWFCVQCDKFFMIKSNFLTHNRNNHVMKS